MGISEVLLLGLLEVLILQNHFGSQDSKENISAESSIQLYLLVTVNIGEPRKNRPGGRWLL